MVAGTYMVTSILWWGMERNFKSVYALSIPWFCFGLAFLMLGVAPFLSPWQTAAALEDVATCLYAAGASSGALSFALNFGDEGKSNPLFLTPMNQSPVGANENIQAVLRQNNGSLELWQSQVWHKSTVLPCGTGVRLWPIPIRQ
jgi:hypothetical protein